VWGPARSKIDYPKALEATRGSSKKVVAMEGLVVPMVSEWVVRQVREQWGWIWDRV